MQSDNFTYKRTVSKETPNQYSDETGQVIAKYRSSLYGKECDSPYIDALPDMIPQKYLVDKYIQETLKYPEFSPSRLFLPHLYSIISNTHYALMRVYKRGIMRTTGENAKIPIHYKNHDAFCQSVFLRDGIGDCFPGFAYCGTSEESKETILNVISDWYPKAIIHKQENRLQVQIPCLIVRCGDCQKESDVYTAFGKALDGCLENTDPYYESTFRKRKPLYEKIFSIGKLIRLYAIGNIILDEIHNIPPKKRGELFTSFLCLENEYAVSISVIDTKDVYGKLVENSWTYARIGENIARCRLNGEKLLD